MTDKERRMLNNLDINNINSKGRYVDVTVPLIFSLTFEQIEYLRELYNDNSIAKDVNIQRKVEVNREENVTRQYKVTREQKYNTGKHRTKNKINFIPIGKVIVGVLVISLAVGSIKLAISKKNEKVPVDTGVTIGTSEDSYEVSNKAINTQYPIEIIDEVTGEEVIVGEEVVIETPEVTEVQEEIVDNPIQDVNGKLIQELCNIYHVNYEVVYPYLKDVTDNFSNEKYLNGEIDGVTCKGETVKASSERELLVYAVRCIKQLPGRMGVSTSNLYRNNGYESGKDYLRQIDKVCNDLGLNRCLMYAIVYSECNFNSEMFMNINNPAGIRNDGEWWKFDTKEEGFYELGMEMLKYYRMIGKSPTQVDKETIAEIRDIHAPIEDGNDLWLPNVLENFEYAMMNEATLFNVNNESLVRR